MNDQGLPGLPPAGAAPDSDGAAELVGWAEPLTAGAVAPPASRAALAAALDLHVDDIGGLSDDAVRRSVDRLRGMAERASRLALKAETDDLTGALRRDAGVAALAREVARTRRVTDSHMCVAFADVDGLKQVNDLHGHSAGDQLLVDVVTVLSERLRAYDLVIRFGGDEFIVVLPGLDISRAEPLFTQIHDRLRSRTGGRSISVGLADLAPDDDVTSLVARADAALAERRRRASSHRTR